MELSDGIAMMVGNNDRMQGIISQLEETCRAIEVSPCVIYTPHKLQNTLELLLSSFFSYKTLLNDFSESFKCSRFTSSVIRGLEGERSQAEDDGLREVRPAVFYAGGEEAGDEPEGDRRAGGEAELYPWPDQDVRRPPGAEL